MKDNKFEEGDYVKGVQDNGYIITGEEMKLGLVTFNGTDADSSAGMLNHMFVIIKEHDNTKYVGLKFNVDNSTTRFELTTVEYED